MKSFSTYREPRKVGWSLFEIITLAAFVLWSAVGLAFTVGHLTHESVTHWPMSDSLKAFINLCLFYGDPVLILLAFFNTHLHATRQWTSGVARRWALMILLCAYAIEAFGTTTGFPFGSYHYTDNFGPRPGPVPLVIPFAWHVVVTNALFLVRAVLPHVRRWIEAALVGLVCTLYDSILEPFATTVKHYWIWADGSVPPLNYVAWFVLSALLTYAFAPTLSTRLRWDLRPALVLGLTVAIFLAGEF